MGHPLDGALFQEATLLAEATGVFANIALPSPDGGVIEKLGSR